MAEQRYQAVLAVIGAGETVKDTAARWGVSRQTLHAWLARYEDGGLEGLADRSHRPRSCPHQMGAEVEIAVLEMRRAHPGWGPRRIRFELARQAVSPLPSESGVYRALARFGLIEPGGRRRRGEKWKRWERARPMELWQMDTVGGFVIADGTRAKALTGLDDHSRFCVSAVLMPREGARRVGEGLLLALRRHGVPEEILTDNARVFTGKYHHPPVEVLFDRICRTNGVEHHLTKPRSPTTTGKVERFHRSLRAEFRTDRVFADLASAQAELNEWVRYYNQDRPHQAIGMQAPAARFGRRPEGATEETVPLEVPASVDARTGDGWVCRRASSNGVVCVSWQQVCVGKNHAGRDIDVYVSEELMQFWDGPELVKTAPRTTRGEVRKKNASIPGGRHNLNQGVKHQPQ